MSWSPRHYIRELDKAFAEIDEKFELLQQIDREVLLSDGDVENTLYGLLPRLRRLCDADEIGLVFALNRRGISLKINDDFTSEPLDDQAVADEVIRAVRPGEATFTTLPSSATALLCAPLRLENSAKNGTSFAVLVLITNRLPPDVSPLNEHPIRRYVSQVAEQLGFLVAALIDRSWRQFQIEVARAFVNEKLSFQDALHEVLSLILRQLPSWRPLILEREPLIQLLTRKSDVTHLTIASVAGQTTDDRATEPWDTNIGKPVSVDDSICGIFVQQWTERCIPFLNVNPQLEYPNLYKSFNGQKVPRSELVLPLEIAGRLIGVLNVEHPDPDAFTDVHIFYLRRVAAFISPFIETMIRAIDQMRAKDVSLLYTMYGFLVRLNATYVHKTSQTVPIVYDRLFTLRERLKQNTDGLKEAAEEAFAAFENYDTLSNEFLKAAPDYVRKGQVDLGASIHSARREFDPRHENTDDVPIDVCGVQEPIYVYASMLLKEHIYNLITNARDAVVAYRKASAIANPCAVQADDGRITIMVSRKANVDDEGRSIPGSRVMMRMEDDGTGVKPDILEKLGQYGYTTKGMDGTGYGLAAAKDYVTSLGGGFDYGNREATRGFFVEFFLEEFDSTRHRNERISE